MSIRYDPDERALAASEFIDLFRAVWNRPLDACQLVQAALQRTQNITARDDGELIGCLRLVTDGYFIAAVAEVLVRPNVEDKGGVGAHLMELATKWAPNESSHGGSAGQR